MKSINPATGEVIKEYQEHTEEEVSEILQLVQSDWEQWRRTTFSERAGYMKNAANLIRERSEDYAVLMANEMGKALRDGRSIAKKNAWVCDYYADNAEKFLSDEIIDTDASKSFATFQPIGIVLAVMPWNFPFWQVLRFAAPALMAGNAGVLKHASNVPGCALALEQLFRDAGFPENIFRTLLIPGSRVDSVIENDLVKAVTLTGSTPAGKSVATKAGSVLKKTVLELGGSDAYVVLADADVPAAAIACATSRLINTGQSCISAKRFIIENAVYDEFVEHFVNAMKQAKMVSPLDEEITIGPMARVDLRDELHDQVTASIEKGAKLLLGGEKPDGPGAFYPATVLGDVVSGMPAYHEEFFGPVASVIRAKDEADAIRIANDSIFGLGGAIFTNDVEKGERIAKQEIESGAVFVNSFVASDPRLPFGGIKESGYGRELSHYGIKEFVNIKSVQIR